MLLIFNNGLLLPWQRMFGSAGLSRKWTSLCSSAKLTARLRLHTVETSPVSPSYLRKMVSKSVLSANESRSCGITTAGKPPLGWCLNLSLCFSCALAASMRVTGRGQDDDIKDVKEVRNSKQSLTLPLTCVDSRPATQTQRHQQEACQGTDAHTDRWPHEGGDVQGAGRSSGVMFGCFMSGRKKSFLLEVSCIR